MKKAIRNRKLRNVSSKGPSYREQNNINWDTNQKIFRKAIRNYKLRWARKEKVDSRTLDEWECTILDTIQRRIDKIRKKEKKSPRKNMFYWEKSVRNTLRTFKNVLS